jgi:hypothetical protein
MVGGMNTHITFSRAGIANTIVKSGPRIGLGVRQPVLKIDTDYPASGKIVGVGISSSRLTTAPPASVNGEEAWTSIGRFPCLGMEDMQGQRPFREHFIWNQPSRLQPRPTLRDGGRGGGSRTTVSGQQLCSKVAWGFLE